MPGALGWNYSYNYFGESTGRVTFASNVTSGPARDASLDRSYDYDHVGRLQAAYTGTSSLAHTGQGSTWGAEGPYAQDYGYDEWGNITHRGGWGGVGRNENLSYTNNRHAGVYYDAAGNMVDGSWYTFSYDATGQQTKAATPIYVLDQAYDGDRLRGKKVDDGVTTYYLRSSVLGGQVIAELSNTGAWTRGYVYLGGQMVALQGGSGGAVSWVHQDPVTKSQRITDSSGNVISKVDLDPFGGDTLASSSAAFQPHRFTSYERDALGADDAMNRRYNRYWGRFDQADPYDRSYEGTNPQSFNRYSYVQNDPVNFVDPTGLFCIDRERWDERTATLYVWQDCYLEGPFDPRVPYTPAPGPGLGPKPTPPVIPRPTPQPAKQTPRPAAAPKDPCVDSPYLNISGSASLTLFSGTVGLLASVRGIYIQVGGGTMFGRGALRIPRTPGGSLSVRASRSGISPGWATGLDAGIYAVSSDTNGNISHEFGPAIGAPSIGQTTTYTKRILNQNGCQ